MLAVLATGGRVEDGTDTGMIDALFILVCERLAAAFVHAQWHFGGFVDCQEAEVE